MRILLTVDLGFVGETIICYLKSPEAYFNVSRSGNKLIFGYDHDYSSNSFDMIKIEYDEDGETKTIYVTRTAGDEKDKIIIQDFNPNVKRIKVIYDLQYDRLAPSILHKKEIISID